MPEQQPARYRFGIFEADAVAGELRRQGLRVRLNAQPFQLLLMLLEHPGELLTREEIEKHLWPDGTFVDYDHGVNSAINRLREALGDTAANPRFIETLARRGYRFVASVERVTASGNGTASAAEPELQSPTRNILATPNDLPRAPYPLVQTLFVLFQLMYLAFYIGALANLGEIDGMLAPLRYADAVFYTIIVSAAILIQVRAFTLFAALFHAPRFKVNFLKLWPFLLIFDEIWALSPFLLMHHIEMGVGVACMALLVYSPFAQRSIVLMGAGKRPSDSTSS